MTTSTAGRPLLHRWEVVIGVIAVVAALVFNAWQVRLQTAALEAQTKSVDAQRKAFEAQVWQMLMQQQWEISKILIEKPELLPYFRGSKRIHPSDKDYERVTAVADMYLDFFDGFDDDYVRSLPKMGENGTNWLIWERYFQDTFALSPTLCARYEEVKDWYTVSVGKYAAKGCKTITSNNTVEKDARKGSARLSP